MYILMNKDRMVAEIDLEYSFGIASYVVKKKYGSLPYGADQITSWIEGRKASKHNRHLRQLMVSCGCDKTEGYIRLTHAASLNDTFWIKGENELVTWENVSLYRNKFNETVSRLAFEGVGLYGMQFSLTSPEFSTSGSFRKCWMREDGEIYLYKRGTEKYANAGLEPYCESMASELALHLCGDAVRYDCTILHGEKASKCRLFTSEKDGYVPYAVLYRTGIAENNPGKYYERIGYGEKFRRMLVLDALTFNSDRHEGNHGVIVDNDTLEVKRMAPIFDMNLSMLPYATEEDFKDIGAYIESVQPVIGDDFTATAQSVLTPSIRADLINLKGFEFSFRGDEAFPSERVKEMERIVNRHIDAILGRKICYTSEVFPNLGKQKAEAFRKIMISLEDEPGVTSVDFVPVDGIREMALVSIEGDNSVGLYFNDNLEPIYAEVHEGERMGLEELQHIASKRELCLINEVISKFNNERDNKIRRRQGKKM